MFQTTGTVRHLHEHAGFQQIQFYMLRLQTALAKSSWDSNIPKKGLAAIISQFVTKPAR